MVGLGGGMGMDGALCLGLYLSHTHYIGGGRAQREEVHARRTYSRLFPNHTHAGTRWSSFLYEKGSPHGNLAHVLGVQLVEGGSPTMGEQTNCNLTRYVKLKKEANHVGPTLEARLDFGETAQNDPMVKRLQNSFIRKLERCQQIGS